MTQLINRNILWARIFADRLIKSKIRNILISPGSRNTPLIFALSEKKYFNIKVIVDERTSGFFALGSAKASRKPTVIVTTSGTAVAELYPAIIEAYQQRIPLIICTADRPKHLRKTGANQTINQENIYKNHICKYYNAGLPSVNYNKLSKFSSSVDELIDICEHSNRGPVHINFPFDKPFEPDSFTDSISENIVKSLFSQKRIISKLSKSRLQLPKSFLLKLEKESEGIILCGGGNFSNKFANKITKLSRHLKYPIIADGTSSLRFGKHRKTNVIINASAFLKNDTAAKTVVPKLILQFGYAPTSNALLNYFKNSKAEKFSVNEFGDLHDPSKTTKQIFGLSEDVFIDTIIGKTKPRKSTVKNGSFVELKAFENFSEKIKSRIVYKSKFPSEGRITNEVVNNIPSGSNLVISNSTPVRDLDFFSPASSKHISVFTNRGASGIDGVISTSLGIAETNKKQTFLIIGDLAFYHDINSLQIAKEYNIPLTIILVDNSGGGIFNMLPVAKYKNVFLKYFRTELNIDFKSIVKGFGGNYFLIKSWKSLNLKLNNFDKSTNFSVMHIKTNSEKSLTIRKKYWALVQK